MQGILDTITLSDLKDLLLIVAAIIGAYVSISTFTGKIKDKRFKPVTDSLEEIKTQIKTLNDEMVLLLKVQTAMASELEVDGKVNGKTQKALDALNEYIIKNINS